MRKIFLLLIAIITMGTSVLAHSNTDEQESKNTIKVNTLSLLVGSGSIFYEREIAPNSSLQLGTLYMNYKISDFRYTGLILTPEYRFFPRGNAINGMYVGPYLRIQNYSASVSSDKVNYFTFGGGGVIGRQWIRPSGFTMDLFAGLHYSKSKLTAGEAFEDNKINFSGIGTRIGFAIGFSF
jgi:hypothetical protein